MYILGRILTPAAKMRSKSLGAFALGGITWIQLAVAVRFEEAARIATRGCAGFEHFEIQGRHYIATANFFTSSAGRRPDMHTHSVLFEAQLNGAAHLQLTEVQKFSTIGAHGWEFFHFEGDAFLVVPNYYGGSTVLYRWAPEPRYSSRSAWQAPRVKFVGWFSPKGAQLI